MALMVTPASTPSSLGCLSSPWWSWVDPSLKGSQSHRNDSVVDCPALWFGQSGPPGPGRARAAGPAPQATSPGWGPAAIHPRSRLSRFEYGTI